MSLPPNCKGTNNPSITCNPSKPGNYNISCTVKDSAGSSVTLYGTLKVNKK